MNTVSPIFVISLARATERRADISRRLDAFGISYQIMDAVDGDTLDMSSLQSRLRQDKAKKYYGAPLLSGEIGCYLSHYNLWQQMVEEKIETALILEDDVEFADDFFATVADVVASEWHWQIVNLSTIKPSKICKVLQFVGDGRKFGLSPRSRSTCAAYLIRLAAAKKLLTYCHEIREPIDTLCVRWWQHGETYYYVSPPPASQSNKYASIIGGRSELPPHLRPQKSLQASFYRKRERWNRFWAVKFHRPQRKN